MTTVSPLLSGFIMCSLTGWGIGGDLGEKKQLFSFQLFNRPGWKWANSFLNLHLGEGDEEMVCSAQQMS